MGREDGAALVAVVVVMVVGFVVVSLVGVAAMFSMQSTQAEAGRVRALVAAESGRDAMLGALTSGGCAVTTLTGTEPTFTARVFPVSVPAGGGLPSSTVGLVERCPDASTTHVVISSEGTADRQSVTVDAVYEWKVEREVTRLGGSVGGGSGFTVLASAFYEGDLVIRSGDFNCDLALPLLNHFDGDVYVLNGNARILGFCSLSGDLYVSGDVTGVGTVSGRIVAGGSISFLVFSASKSNGPFDPPAEELLERTQWFDLNEATAWPGFTTELTLPAATCNSPAVRGQIVDLLNGSGGKIVIDTSACIDQIDLSPAFLSSTSVTVKRDVVLLVNNGFRFASGWLSGGGGKLYVVQTNTSADPENPAPRCEGRTGITLTASGGWGGWPETLVYSPCGVTVSGAGGVNILSGFKGQIIAPTSGSWNILATRTCARFTIPGLFDLVCDLSDAGSSGGTGGTGGASAPGALVRQTER
ncbi:hypothetical protein [Microbacterium sp. No. 7]|uniref:hypothetical protein n=1 Tax=Microbacterium sp. No. 7 TaxID=1714373 RepID=UPI0006CF5519|nr:hypothetical protein [Microbacterium sp. No. 7]ALJ18742.1 hypothetical protein AOA12_01960 [Microbacterium sp. No. 7]